MTCFNPQRLLTFIKGNMRKENEIPESPEPPEKCPTCGSVEYEQYNHDYIDTTLCEYSVRCKSCKQQLAHWAYGHWQY